MTKPTESEDRLLEIAQRIGDGTEIDWEEESSVLEGERELVERLRKVSEVGRAHREVHVAEESHQTEAAPEAIGEYCIRRRLGSGGLGVVYEAEHRGRDGTVALKVIRGPRAQDPEAVRIFEREARTLSQLNHPSIAGIYESGCTAEGEHFIAIEFVQGQTLTEWRTNRPIAAAESTSELKLRLGIFGKICEALAYAHERGVIHKDLKPSNILVLESNSPDSEPAIKVLDFGLARAAFLSGITEPGRIRGTLPYMSPEQARGASEEIDARTDIYSLGVILYELLTGSRPYDLDQDSFRGKIQAILTAPPRPLAELWRGPAPADPALERILQKALEKEAASRHPNVPAMIEELERFRASLPSSGAKP